MKSGDWEMQPGQSMIREHGWMLGKLVRISAANNYIFRTPYEGTVGLVVKVPKVETAHPTARVMHHDGSIGSWFYSDLQVIDEVAA